ncbi:GNAT family N-acetyltransferase [Roseibium suaedae]|uniref:N-acetylglutamate synthase, GNAT family n=1 Tax=Roseibium suaedae TaxID=735517 RepID=A0A1M7M8I8_9HYPH|nr:GNAT family N-acetyltransferase [Roseibium suaedae]SHM87053.1 N-acetylglutamate synthase, GNAT family [Roseibium suaedae]
MDLRRAVITDAQAIADLARDAYEHYIPVIKAVPQPMQADYAELIAADEVWLSGPSDQPDASLVLRLQPDHLLLWSIAVAPHRQGSGLGNHLLDFCFQRARDHQKPELRLFTNALMTSNQLWYQRRGFRETRREQIGDKLAVHMSAPVPEA